MATQIRNRIAERPLNVVLRPSSPAEAAYRSAVLAPGFEPAEGDGSCEVGLGGYHGGVPPRRSGRRRETVYCSVAVSSEGGNGIVAFDEPWKNVCATLYHELQEVRTDPDVEDAIRAGHSPAAARLLGWYSPRAGEIADIPIAETHGDIRLGMREVALADGSGAVPVQ